jgi:CHAT domain-containing protein/tetratricopeptide (TPR) repeat protein
MIAISLPVRLAIRRWAQALATFLALPVCMLASAQPSPAPQPQSPPPAASAAPTPSAMQPLLRAASQALEAKDHARTLELVEQHLGEHPKDADGYGLKADALQELGRIALAVEASREATILNPGKFEHWNRLCWYQILAHQPLRARPACEQARVVDPANWMAIVNLGHTWLLTGDAETAQRYYRDTVWRVPDEAALNSGPLADFHLFLSKGWQPRAALASEKWFERTWPQWQTAEVSFLQVKLLTAAGELGKAVAPAQQMVKLALDILGDAHPVSAHLMGRLATVYRSLGQPAQALPLYRRALAISEKAEGSEHPSIGKSLNNLALLFQDMGQYAQALPLSQRALAISEKAEGPDHPETGTRLNNLANLYRDMGQYAHALPLFQRALAISEKTEGPDHPSTGTTLNNLASLYEALGQYAQALPLYQRALAIVEKSRGSNHPVTGASLNNLAGLYEALGQHAQALPLYQRALAIAERSEGPGHPSTAVRLNNLAGLYQHIGQYAQALPLFQRALTILEKSQGTDHPQTGTSLNNLAGLYWVMGQYAQALPLLYRAEHIAAVAGDPKLQWMSNSGIAAILARQGDPASAIFWGKQAVNTIQSLRGGLINLDRELQTSFLNDKRWVYTELSQQLIAAGRIPEAQRVMALLKEEELFDFVRRDADRAPASSELPLTGVERKASERYGALRESLAKVAQESLRIEERRRKGGATAEDLARLETLKEPLRQAREAFETFKSELRQMLAAQPDKQQQVDLVLVQIRSHQAMLRSLEAAGQDTAAVQYVVGRDRLSMIVSTRAVQLAREVPIGEEALNQLIAELRGQLQDPRLDPRAAAQRLHALLIEPIQADLADQGVRRLMLMPDGALRYLPFAALHDGWRYLVEQLELAIYTPAGSPNLAAKPQPEWQVAAFGVTRAFPEQRFAALPAVRGELAGIVNPQVMPGRMLLDEQFTARALQDQVASPVLHIASHFRFEEGNDDTSYLLLGDGGRLSLAQLRTWPRLDDVDLMTLSACDTAVGGGRRWDGHEVEGLAGVVQNQGAKAVLASLWPVADRSTGELMQRFYRAREGGQRNKAQALRQAQLVMLGAAGGDARGAGRSEARGAKPAAATPGGGDGKPAPFAAPAEAPYAHPYYWAPFILMGNWL